MSQRFVPRVHYLYHSGFLVDTGRSAVVFDYYRDQADQGRRLLQNGVIQPSIFDDRTGLVLVSHAHEDHYNPVIFKWQKPGRNITYVIDHEVPLRGQQATAIRPGQVVQVEGGQVQAFGSTDTGCSFYVQIDGLNIFHAGDLNFWHWRQDSTPAEVTQAKDAFVAIVEQLHGLPMDLAFFPVDARMGRGYAMGAAYFARECRPKVLVPMHFTAHPKAAGQFAGECTWPDVQVWVPAGRGDVLTLPAVQHETELQVNAQ